MKLKILNALFLIASGCTVSACAQFIRVAETEQPTNRMSVSRRIDRKLPSRITVRIYYFDHVELGVITKAKEVTAEIMGKAGLETLWAECASQERCSTEADGPEFRVRIIPSALGNAIVSDDSLGFAVPCADTEEACLCYVFYWRIKALAENYHIGADRLLGHVVAHEIGHALLGPNAHSPYGIMRHNLPVRETERILYFISSQAKQLRADLAARNAVLTK